MDSVPIVALAIAGRVNSLSAIFLFILNLKIILLKILIMIKLKLVRFIMLMFFYGGAIALL